MASLAFLISLAAASNKTNLTLQTHAKIFSLSFDAIVAVIDGFQLAVGVDLLAQEGKISDLLFYIPQAFPCADGGGGNGVALLHQFLIATDAVFGEKVHGGGRPFQILNGCPPLVSGALLGLDVVLNVNKQADLPVALPGLSGGAGASGDPGRQTASSV